MDMMLEQFKTIFDRPEKVKKLRETILDLAVRGKLVEQNPNDEPASVLLERIKEEKERLSKDKIIKKDKEREVLELSESSNLPKGWERTKLGTIINFQNGYAFKSKDFTSKGIGIVRIGDLVSGKISESKMVYISEDIVVNREFLMKNGDLVIAMSGATTGKLAFNNNNKDYYINQRVGKIDIIYCDKKYIYYLLSTKIEENLNKSVGSAIPNLSTEQIKNIDVVLPPIEEQKRIVEKVDSLMSFCDKLEKALEKKVHYGELSAKSVFNAVGNVDSVEELEEVLRFILLNFKDLSLGDNAVKELKNCILQLAVQGKLVPQDLNDEPIKVFLKRINKEKTLLEIQEKERYFKLPDSWSFIRLGDIIYEKPRNGYSPKGVDYKTNVKNLTLTATTSGFFKKDKFKYIDETIARDSHLWLRNGDILIQRSNSLEYVGVSCIYDGGKNEYIYPDLMMKVRIIEEINNKYIYYVLSSMFVREYFRNSATGTSKSMIKINQSIVTNTVIPLAPLEEQKRIVEKVDSLMILCDKLEKKIQKQKDYNNRLMESIIKSSL